MKIKVDKEEYERLLTRVKVLEEYKREEWERLEKMTKHMQKYLEDFFAQKCVSVMLKRDKEMIVAEVRQNVIDNLFKESNGNSNTDN